MNFRLYNTMSKRIEPFTPTSAERVSFYTCGPTVYDDAHIGNFRSFLAADLLRRWIESPLCTLQDAQGKAHTGPRTVVHVMNITDVGHMTDDSDADGGGEDKMVAAAQRITEAKKTGKLPKNAGVDPNDPFAVAAFYRARFLEDARALGLKVAAEAESDPSLMPSATDHIGGMRRVIAQLLETGFAYAAGDSGSRAIYFDVQRADRYGALSGNTLDRVRGGAGGRVDDDAQQQKRHPADFLLWKEDAAHKMKWDAPDHPACAGWDKGYPGWHIECTAMALERLMPGGLDSAAKTHARIDLHSGGEDNIFPHHECEIAQSCAFTGSPTFSGHWFHPRFLMVDGQKMSKSKGTFFTPRDLMSKGHDPAAIRLELIKTHYRANADFSMQGLRDSANRISRWRTLASALHQAASEGRNSPVPTFDDWVKKFVHAMSSDLNIAGALSALDVATNALNMDLASSKEPSIARDENGEHLPIPEEPWDEGRIRTLLDSGNQAEMHLGQLHLIDRVIGVIFQPTQQSQQTGIALYRPGVEPSDQIESLLAERRDARKSKDFARSDAIRDQLAAMGYTIKDMPEGRVEVAPR
jgi:cysteinyl-tRNA synthetase